MTHSGIIGCGLIGAVVVGSQPVSNATVQNDTAGWTTLFDGSSLDGWDVIGDANWVLTNGTVQADSGSGFLVTSDSYGDFELLVEFWVDELSNSGVFIRCGEWRRQWQECIGPAGVRDATSYEVNIFDTRPDQAYRTGGIVNVASPMSTINAGGRWNTFEITAQAQRLTVVLNGTRMVDTEDGQYAVGPIALQKGKEPGTVKFRDVRIRTQ
jgi:hypothetical protein